jgi:hypothetical protein
MTTMMTTAGNNNNNNNNNKSNSKSKSKSKCSSWNLIFIGFLIMTGIVCMLALLTGLIVVPTMHDANNPHGNIDGQTLDHPAFTTLQEREHNNEHRKQFENSYHIIADHNNNNNNNNNNNKNDGNGGNGGNGVNANNHLRIHPQKQTNNLDSKKDNKDEEDSSSDNNQAGQKYYMVFSTGMFCTSSKAKQSKAYMYCISISVYLCTSILFFSFFLVPYFTTIIHIYIQLSLTHSPNKIPFFIFTYLLPFLDLDGFSTLHIALLSTVLYCTVLTIVASSIDHSLLASSVSLPFLCLSSSIIPAAR